MQVKKEVFTSKSDGTTHFNRKEADYTRNRLIHLAKKKAESVKCSCGQKDRKVVPLFEFGDPYIPSQVVLYCPACRKNEVFAMRPPGEATQYAELVAGKKYDGKAGEKPNKEQEKANKLIEEALEMAKKPLAKKIAEDDKSIKDEDNKVIANKDAVNKADSKK